ncbi:GumC family protein [Geopsychrobacter electrodiphilus]|uniref:GumC family protein n=1 Tax=Geopsychrobacter electrodiphilus TaxID=225196 RepID=UPI00037CCA82|nr:polysaccharide biosynthesis tyrosine autokinase [Geopsychrobacter electrodiphilus]
MHANQSQPNPPSPQEQFEEVHLQDYLQVIYRRRRVVLLVFVLVLAAVSVFTFMQTPIYETSATLHVRDEKVKGGAMLGDLGLSRDNPIETEIEILKARTNIEQVVKQLHLNWQVDNNKAGLSFSILEFSSQAEEPSYRIVLTGTDSFRVEDSDGHEVATGKSGTLVRAQGFSLLLQGLSGHKGDHFRLCLADFNRTVQNVRQIVRASEVGKGTNIIQLSYQSADPQQARDVVNRLAQIYLERSINTKSEEASKSVDFIEQQLGEVRTFLGSAEQKLEDFKRANQVVKLDSEAELLVTRLSESETERNTLQLQLRQIDFAIRALKDARTKGEVYAPSVLQANAVVASLTQRLAELEVERRGLLTDVTQAHPQVQKIQGEMAELQRKLLQTFEAAKQALDVQIDTLHKQMLTGEAKLRTLPHAEQELARLTRLATVNADIYVFLLQKHQEARIAKAATISNINVIDPAITPERPIKPKKRKNLLLGFIVAGMLGVGLAFFLEYLDDSINDSESAKRVLGLPILSTIPHIELREKHDKIKSEEGQRILISQLEPRSPAAEAFRSLRTSLHFSGVKKEHRVILVASTFPNEGKTTVSANLALTLAQTGQKVLLIGCDLRKPTLHTMFNVAKTPGLTEILIGDCAVADAVHKTGFFELDFINAGTKPPNPSELLGSEAMTRLVLKLQETYDAIVLDAPPVLAVTDTPVLSRLADQLVVVVEVGGVQIKAAQRNIEILRSVEAPISGLVLNDKSGKGADYYSYYSYYGKRYGTTYTYGSDDHGYEDKKPKGLLKRLLGKK